MNYEVLELAKKIVLALGTGVTSGNLAESLAGLRRMEVSDRLKN